MARIMSTLRVTLPRSTSLNKRELDLCAFPDPSLTNGQAKSLVSTKIGKTSQRLREVEYQLKEESKVKYSKILIDFHGRHEKSGGG
jgi:hypothetical protein